MYVLLIRTLVLGKLQFVVFLLQEKIFLTLGKSPFIVYDFIMHAICINIIAVIFLALLWPRR